MAQVPATRRGQGGRLAARREHPLERLQRDFDTLFGTLLGGWQAPMEQDFGPVRLWDFDVKDNDREIVVRAEMPGFEPNEVNVQVDNGVLTISGEKEQKGDGREESLSFYRALTLPPGIDAARAQANYRNGVLELHIPRAEGAQPRRIEVQGEQGALGQQGQQGTSDQARATATQAGNGGQQAGSQTQTATAADKAKK